MDLPIRRALISVSDKSGLLELARQLVARGVQILSTGGTARALTAAGIEVREVADFTGFPEIMDGRVKTLHPKIHGGLLGRRGTDDVVMARENILPIDLLVVNLYPFAATVAKPGVSYDEAIENIDVGGPAMLRGAAKNHADVTVVVDPADYPGLLAELNGHDGGTRFEYRARLAAKAFAHTATYDSLVADYLLRKHPMATEPFPVNLGFGLTRIAALRYGEKPASAWRVLSQPRCAQRQHRRRTFAQGKELSFNNIADADAARECVRQFDRPALRDREACEPVRRGDRGHAHRRLRTCVPHRSDFGLRRHHRVQPRARRRDRAADPRTAVRRGDGGARPAARRGSRALQQTQCARAGHRHDAAALPHRRASCAVSAAACWPRSATPAGWMRTTSTA